MRLDQDVEDREPDALDAATWESPPVLIVVESDDGLAGSVIDVIPSEIGPIRRVGGAEATKGKIGCMAETLDLQSPGEGALVIENAQWVDATSMGHIKRLLEQGRRGELLVVIAHRPLEVEDSWWIDQLTLAAGRHGRVLSVGAEPHRDTNIALPSNPTERDLVIAARLISDPIPVPVLARLLGIGEPETLDLAEGLASRGLLLDTQLGFVASPSSRGLDMGEARLAGVARRLAEGFEEAGGDSSVVGSLYQRAGSHDLAYRHLYKAGIDAQDRAAGEAYHLAVAALAAAENSSAGTPTELGNMHLACGRFLRSAGRSEAAAKHLDEAVSLLEGSARIDALGFAASVADDRQHPQEAERILAIAEWEAATQNQVAKLGSIGTFRSRALNRLGFANESDALLAKASAILTAHATPIQQFYGDLNRAWILFDRGQVAKAEAEFTRLRDRTESHDLAGVADKEAWRARALFATGHPQDAIEAVANAREAATQAGVEAPLFLADLALVEGNLLYGRPAEALEASERVLDLVDRQLPAWENVARANRALALLRLGRIDEARSEIAAALTATPAGADGWRWRSRCRAIQIEISTHAGAGFPQREAEDLADMLLQSEFFGWASELLCVVAEQTNDGEAAREAMALAVQIGNPMLAARAAHAGNLWGEPVSAPVVRKMRAIAQRVPDTWDEAWTSIPAVVEALSAPEPGDDETGDENLQILESAFRRAGLVSADTVLSPAQRRNKGLVRHRRRKRSPLTLVAAAAAVIVLAGATSLAVAQLNQPDEQAVPEVAQTVPTTAAEPLSLEETGIEVPAELLFGSSLDRGDYGRSGFVDVAGPRTVDGYYWVFSAADAITATPLAYGNNLMVGSADGNFHAINLTTGRGEWTLSTDAQIDASATFSISETSAGQAAPVGEVRGAAAGTVVVVGDDGVVRARDSLVVTSTQIWSTPIGSTIKASPVIDNGVVFVAGTNGVVHALDMSNGDVLWRYPSEDGASMGRITADLAVADGIVYVGTEEGTLSLIGVDGALVCESTLDAPITVNPVVAGGLAYISYGQLIRILPAGVCPDQIPLGETVQFLSETVVDVAPAVAGDLIYVPNAGFLNAVDRVAIERGVTSPEQAHHWSEGSVNAESKISSPPVVTRDAVYFGTESGKVYAVDSDTGELLWEWQTGNYVRASPVVIEGAVYIASGDGKVYAIGPAG